jgi:hypothetical protein
MENFKKCRNGQQKLNRSAGTVVQKCRNGVPAPKEEVPERCSGSKTSAGTSFRPVPPQFNPWALDLSLLDVPKISDAE